MASVFISFILAFATGLWLYNSQVEQERSESREAHIEQLEHAVFYILCNFEVIGETTVRHADTTFSYWRGYMPTIAFEEAIRSGAFNGQEVIVLIFIEAQVNDYNQRVRFLDMVSASKISEDRKFAELRILESNRRTMLNNCRHMVRLFPLDVSTVDVANCERPSALETYPVSNKGD